jgi:hypothetical protein
MFGFGFGSSWVASVAGAARQKAFFIHRRAEIDRPFIIRPGIFLYYTAFAL